MVSYNGRLAVLLKCVCACWYLGQYNSLLPGNQCGLEVVFVGAIIVEHSNQVKITNQRYSLTELYRPHIHVPYVCFNCLTGHVTHNKRRKHLHCKADCRPEFTCPFDSFITCAPAGGRRPASSATKRAQFRINASSSINLRPSCRGWMWTSGMSRWSNTQSAWNDCHLQGTTSLIPTQYHDWDVLLQGGTGEVCRRKVMSRSGPAPRAMQWDGSDGHSKNKIVAHLLLLLLLAFRHRCRSRNLQISATKVLSDRLKQTDAARAHIQENVLPSTFTFRLCCSPARCMYNVPAGRSAPVHQHHSPDAILHGRS